MQQSDTSFYTPMAEIAKSVAACRGGATERLLFPVPKRKEALRGMLRLVKENNKALKDALFADVGKHPVESDVSELLLLETGFVFLIDHVDEWAKEERAPTEGVSSLMDCRIKSDPLGCVLVISAWNYPVLLSLNPVAGALCAGNTVILKPSEVSPATAKLLAELIPRYLPKEMVSVVNGGVAETTELLQNHRFDHIFYTGNGTVGKIVMAAAAKNLTPVTLELGGKSPTIIDKTCAKDMDTVAARVLWGRYSCSGQTCIAPDYMIVHESMKEAFIAAFQRQRAVFMKGSASVAEDTSYARMVNERHFDRVAKLLDGSCGRVVVGGEMDRSSLKIGVTLLDDVKLDSPLMQEEIFGPLLPMITYSDENEVVEFINARPKPLALYIFTASNKKFIERLKTETSSGAIVVNDVIMHASVEALPFGGVGASGMGSYHGRSSFDNFSHRKAVLQDTLGLESIKRTRYAPYTEKKAKTIRMALEPWGEKSALRKAIEKAFTSSRVACVLCFVAGVVATHLYNRRSGAIVL